MSKRQDDLRRLANDKSTTQGERDAARRALGEMPETLATTSMTAIGGTPTGLEVVRHRMPPWVKGERGPHHGAVVAFGKRMLRRGYDSASNHDAMRGYCSDYSRHDRMAVTWKREEFILEQYSDHVSTIEVVLGSKKFEIYTSSYAGGWRDGPWWSRLFDLFQRWTAEADAYDAAEARKEAAKEQARRAAEDDAFTSYAKKCG